MYPKLYSPLSDEAKKHVIFLGRFFSALTEEEHAYFYYFAKGYDTVHGVTKRLEVIENERTSENADTAHRCIRG